MKTSKSLYSEHFQEYLLTDAQREALQAALLNMLLDVKAVCDKYDIAYMLSGGTALGAVRHKGFIPWDDDIDLMMLRTEYEKFAPRFREEYPDKYLLAEPLCDGRYISKMVKIHRLGTTYTELPLAGIGAFDMVFLDLFLIENVPKPGPLRRVKGRVYDFAFKAASVSADYRFPSPPILKKAETDREVRDYYAVRRQLGRVFSHVGGLRFYLRICERLGAQKKRTGWLGIPSAISYEREIFEERVFRELADAEFCGHTFKIPRDYDAYLRNLYGDYMQIPPPEKREYHTAYQLNL